MGGRRGTPGRRGALVNGLRFRLSLWILDLPAVVWFAFAIWLLTAVVTAYWCAHSVPVVSPWVAPASVVVPYSVNS